MFRLSVDGLKNSKICLVLFALLLLATPAMAEEAHVLKVIDGDSLRIEIRGIHVDLRLLGIDAPEYNKPGGAEATQFVKDWLGQDDTIDLEFDRRRYGKYGRLLAWVWHDGHLLQEDLVRAGHAEVKWLSKKDKYYSRLTEKGMNDVKEEEREKKEEQDIAIKTDVSKKTRMAE